MGMVQKRPSNLSSALALLFLFVNVCLAFFIFAPKDHFNLANVLHNTGDQETNAPVAIGQSDQYFEWKLVDQYPEGHYFVEKYEEYEVTQENGKKVKETPTSNYNYLKYWRSQ
jgi:hypothetical protein